MATRTQLSAGETSVQTGTNAEPRLFSDSIRFNLDETALKTWLAAREGPVGRDLERRAIRVQSAATRLCPVATGRLQSSIDYVLSQDAQGPVAYVGSNVEYALYVELGTFASDAQPYLRPALFAASGSGEVATGSAAAFSGANGRAGNYRKPKAARNRQLSRFSAGDF